VEWREWVGYGEKGGGGRREGCRGGSSERGEGQVKEGQQARGRRQGRVTVINKRVPLTSDRLQSKNQFGLNIRIASVSCFVWSPGLSRTAGRDSTQHRNPFVSETKHKSDAVSRNHYSEGRIGNLPFLLCRGNPGRKWSPGRAGKSVCWAVAWKEARSPSACERTAV
jgi:hypothetical protein